MPFNIDFSKLKDKKHIGPYTLGKTVGKGHFSKVKQAVDSVTGQIYAIKIVDRSMLVKEKSQKQMRREISVLRLLHHPHIINLHDVMEDERHVYLVMEWVPGGELFDKIVEQKRLSEPLARKYFQQLISGIDYCHSQGIAHRDLKPENCLLDTQGNLKISDFGLSALSAGVRGESLLKTACGTPNYVAPEVIRQRGYLGFPADIWSCGVILFVMLAGYLPFDAENRGDLFDLIKSGKYHSPKGISPEVKSLIRKMLAVNPSERITISEIKELPWFRDGLDPTLFAAPATPTSPTRSDHLFVSLTDQWDSDEEDFSVGSGCGSTHGSVATDPSSNPGRTPNFSPLSTPKNQSRKSSVGDLFSSTTASQESSFDSRGLMILIDRVNSDDGAGSGAAAGGAEFDRSCCVSEAGSSRRPSFENLLESTPTSPTSTRVHYHDETPLSAFDLLSLSMSSLQQTLLSPNDFVAPTHFIARGEPGLVIDRICDVLRRAQMNPLVKPSRPHHVKCFVPQKNRTALYFHIDVIPIAGHVCSLVEFTRGHWNTLQFTTFFKEILPLFSELQASPSPSPSPSPSLSLSPRSATGGGVSKTPTRSPRASSRPVSPASASASPALRR